MPLSHYRAMHVKAKRVKKVSGGQMQPEKPQGHIVTPAQKGWDTDYPHLGGQEGTKLISSQGTPALWIFLDMLGTGTVIYYRKCNQVQRICQSGFDRLNEAEIELCRQRNIPVIDLAVESLNSIAFGDLYNHYPVEWGDERYALPLDEFVVACQAAGAIVLSQL